MTHTLKTAGAPRTGGSNWGIYALIALVTVGLAFAATALIQNVDAGGSSGNAAVVEQPDTSQVIANIVASEAAAARVGSADQVYLQQAAATGAVGSADQVYLQQAAATGATVSASQMVADAIADQEAAMTEQNRQHFSFELDPVEEAFLTGQPLPTNEPQGGTSRTPLD